MNGVKISTSAHMDRAREIERMLQMPKTGAMGVTGYPSPDIAKDYASLRAVLEKAYEQAASGKGRDRHANGKPFDKQPIMEIARMVGIGYQLGQAMKKAQEAKRMEPEAAKRELLGAINYLAAAYLLLEESQQT